MMSLLCDKCGKIVPPHNDAVNLALEMNSTEVGDWLVFSDSRHLLPVFEKEKVICVGSPSRAQYLVGQPRDIRSEYPYKSDREIGMRLAYERMLEEHPIPVPAKSSPTEICGISKIKTKV